MEVKTDEICKVGTISRRLKDRKVGRMKGFPYGFLVSLRIQYLLI